MGGLCFTATLLLYAAKTDRMNVMVGQRAFTNTASLSPGLARKITAADLPRPQVPNILPRLKMYLGMVATGGKRPNGAVPKGPAGFAVGIYVEEGLEVPPANAEGSEWRHLPGGYGRWNDSDLPWHYADGKPRESSVYASLPAAFGINFYPPGPNPQWVYVTNTSTLVRYAYKNGDLKATGAPEKLITDIPAGGGHSTPGHRFLQRWKEPFLAGWVGVE